jgi:hypothetical protein
VCDAGNARVSPLRALFFAFAENFALGGPLLFLDGVISEFKL